MSEEQHQQAVRNPSEDLLFLRHLSDIFQKMQESLHEMNQTLNRGRAAIFAEESLQEMKLTVQNSRMVSSLDLKRAQRPNPGDES